jgi:tetratricopeptide (TPR) repeat protein
VSEKPGAVHAWQIFSRSAVAYMPMVKEPLAVWQPATFSLAQVNRLLEDLLGFSPQFFGFVPAKSLMALWGGMVLLLCGLHLSGEGKRADLWHGVRWGAASVALFIALPLAPRIAGEYHLIQGEQAARRGEPAAALAHLQAARYWKPALGYSWSYYRRVGDLTRMQDRPNARAALLAEAHARLLAKQPSQALQRLRQARALDADEPAMKTFLAIVLAEAAIDAFNGGQTRLAENYWEESLAAVPVNPLPWYGLSLVNGKEQRFEAAARNLEQIDRLQAYLGYKRLPVRSQVLVVKSWEALWRGDLASAHELYSRSLRPETW